MINDDLDEEYLEGYPSLNSIGSFEEDPKYIVGLLDRNSISYLPNCRKYGTSLMVSWEKDELEINSIIENIVMRDLNCTMKDAISFCIENCPILSVIDRIRVVEGMYKYTIIS